MDTFTLKSGNYVFKKGDIPDAAYIIETGAIEISFPNEGDDVRILGVLGPGEVFGEMGPIDGHPRSADAKAISDTVLLRIDSEQINRRLDDSDPFVVGLFKTISIRLRDLYGHHIEQKEEEYKKQQHLIAELKVEKLIGEGLEHEQFVPFFQPIFSLGDKCNPVGFEALVRWKQPDGNYASPYRFIPLAEKSGLIRLMDLEVLNHSCRVFMEKFDALKHCFLSFNMSANHFLHENVVQDIDEIVKRHNFPYNNLKVEITESGLIRYPEVARRILTELKNKGATIALDDFGTGYSSLSYLHSFPIDVMKIDRSFVNNMTEDTKGESIIDAMIALSLSLNMVIIAEGIETEEQKDILVRKKVHQGQGWHFAKAMPTYEAIEFVKKYNPQ